MTFNKKHSMLIGFALIFLLSFSMVSAITGSIGNARMILRVETGDTIDRTILVKNVNNVSVEMELYATGDLESDITVHDSSFTLLAGEEKKAAFTIEVKNSGTTESYINVKFTPTDGKNGVGLSSTVIVIAEGRSWFDWGSDDDDTDDDSDTDTTNSSTDSDNSPSTFPESTPVFLLLFLALVLIVLLVVLLKVLKNKKRKLNKKRSGKK
jgi:hypothetical protein